MNGIKMAVAKETLNENTDPREVLTHGLSDHLRRPVYIVRIESKPLGTFSTHPIHRLRVTLGSAERVTVIFKQLRPKPEKDIRREVLLYQKILAGRRFGAPALYASLCDEAEQRYWLFLEDVGTCKLEWRKMEVWPAAFRWMARMHAECDGREAELTALDCLDHHDTHFYRTLAQAARRSLQEHDETAALLHFDRLIERFFDGSVAYLLRQPRTLVHGDGSCHNLIVQPGPEIRALDWEWAAIGPAAWDVMKLLSGWGKKRQRLLDSYVEEFERHVPLDRLAFARTLEHCRIFHRLWYLRWWIRDCEDPAFVAGLLDQIEQIWKRLETNDA